MGSTGAGAGAGTGHLDRVDYDSPVQALLDARRVLVELRESSAGQLVVPCDHLEFLARRAQQLIEACLDAHLDGRP